MVDTGNPRYFDNDFGNPAGTLLNPSKSSEKAMSSVGTPMFSSAILTQMTATLTCLAAGQNAEDRCDEKKYSKNESEKTIIRYSSQTSAILRVKRLCFKRVSGRTTSEIFLVAASILLAFALSALTSLGWFLVFLVAYGVYLDRRRTARRRSVSGTRISP